MYLLVSCFAHMGWREKLCFEWDFHVSSKQGAISDDPGGGDIRYAMITVMSYPGQSSCFSLQ